MKKTRIFILMAALVLSAGMLTSRAATAKDAVQVTVENYGDNGFVVENGAFQTPGTYAIGTIKLNYMVVGYQFPADDVFKSFDLCLGIIEGISKPATAYPATVNIAQIGTPDVILGLSDFNVAFTAPDDDSYCIGVSVSVPGVVANDPDFQENGTELVANIQLSTGPRTHLDTVTTVKVHLTLVYPSETACIVPLHLVANNDLNANLSSSGISLAVHTNNGLNANHQGQHVVALVNTCPETKVVDLDTAINGNFSLQSAAAVQTTTTNQEFADIGVLLGVDFNNTATFNNAGTAMCLNGVIVPGNQTFVVKQHISMNSNAEFPGSLGNLAVWYYEGFTFAAHTDDDGTTCASGTLSDDVDPNQGEVAIPINQVSYNGPNPPATQYPPSE